MTIILIPHHHILLLMCDKSSDTIKGIHVHGDILIPLLIYKCDNNSDPLTITLILVLLMSDRTSDPITFEGISIFGSILIPIPLKGFLYLAIF